MPSSNLALAPTLIHLVHTSKPKTRILDVGPGHGKYGLLLREYTNGFSQLDAIEAWEPYIQDFKLDCIYDRVYHGDIRDQRADFLAQYDVVLMIDVLEHIEWDEGDDLLRRIPGTVIICTPETFFQNPEHEEIPPEAHRSLWTGDHMRHLGADVVKVEIGGIIARLPKGRVPKHPKGRA